MAWHTRFNLQASANLKKITKINYLLSKLHYDEKFHLRLSVRASNNSRCVISEFKTRCFIIINPTLAEI
jgi:hypothetical protein